MSRLSINELTTYRWSFEEDVTRYKAAGIDGIGVWRQKLADFGEEKGVELLADSELAVSNLLWAGGFTGSDGRSYRDSVEDALEAIRLAAALSADALIVYSGARSGHTHNHARRLLVGAIKEMQPLADELNVTLAIEPMHPGCATDWTFITDLDDAVALLDELENPRVKMALDTYHLGRQADLPERIGPLVDRIAVVHLGDSREPPQKEQNRCRLGEGTIPLKEIVAALMAAGYTGFYDVELIGEDIEQCDYAELIEHSKGMFEQWTDIV
ncbi:MAG: sugar phosphate isomerase/epimerase [Planctomycetes bacterium]|nr:sugar phosphate isomerase/epimerase [Planctomycetota bacterium]